MNCEDTQKLIESYLDGELSGSQAQAIEAHLKDCPGCSADRRRLASFSGLIKSHGRFDTPPALRARIQDSLRQQADATSERSRFSQWLSFGAPSLVFGFAVAWLLALLMGPVNDRAFVDQVIASHVRSLMADHLTDVASSDRHAVKPWFNGRLDFSPPVEDFTGEGFPLRGGRLDYLAGRPVAALVYRHRQHPINLFIGVAQNGADTNVSTVSRQGYHLLHWSRAGLSYWAVSDLNPDDMRKFIALFNRTEPLLMPDEKSP